MNYLLLLLLVLISNMHLIISNEYYYDYSSTEYNITKEKTIETRVLTQEHANLFPEWLDAKSAHLYEMSKNFSAFKLLNETFNTELRNEVSYAVINFTSMIIDISQKLSDVLYKKSLLVENLSDYVEQAYEEYRNDTEKVNESINYVYYDSKSPKTFCDVVENPTKKLETNSSQLLHKRSIDCFKSDYCPNELSIRKSRSSGANQAKRSLTTMESSTTAGSSGTNTTVYDSESEEDYQDDEYDDEEEDEESFDDIYWDIECINRTYDENFKSIQKVNRHISTVQVPTNIFKQELSVNMTAYWTEKLDYQFKLNYENDSELYWQYFCSSNGMFRRYPAAYWTVPKKEDFFDCRLQSWYMMAAASAKDVLFLLDISGSMTGLRLEIGKKLIEFILDTFSDNDFFNIILYSDRAKFLFDDNKDYSNNFIQASKANKIKFRNQLRLFKETNQQAKLKDPLELAFNLFNNTSLTRCGCNKMLMIITDGQEDNVDPIFQKYNSDKSLRVFSFKIGRDMNDLIEIKKLACDNKGEYYHVMTLTDINEHVYEYITVLSRPMALMGVHETKWSNVFIGYLDKELKIAVARPAFKYSGSILENLRVNHPKPPPFNGNIFTKFFTENKSPLPEKTEEEDDELDPKVLSQNQSERLLKKANKYLNNQQVLLGVVGVDVPVLKLISNVSPKYQMGVGIYIIMLDNNGYIVYHPSIKKEIANSASDYKGTSNSVDLDTFEIPINNEDEFEQLEHDMIDQYTGSTILENWKREGFRVIKRRTEYVYTPVMKTPFSVAIASPQSFGRYYIDIQKEREPFYDDQIKFLKLKQFDTLIQLYNCSYKFNNLVDKLLNLYTRNISDYCMKYLLRDSDQILAIKLDLKVHNVVYNLIDYSMFLKYPNLVKSSFYGTYSGITFYLPVTFSSPTNETYNMSLNLFSTETNKLTYSFEKAYYTRSIEFSDYLRTEYHLNEPIVLYFLNHTGNKETISATLPIWLDKVPVSVAGAIYDAKHFKDILFTDNYNCNQNVESKNCSQNRLSICHSNVTCYLVDEHGIIVMTNVNETNDEAVGLPLYKVNPWLMFQLENDGVYNLIVPGSSLQDCNAFPVYGSNSASSLISMLKSVVWLFKHLTLNIFDQIGQLALLILSFSSSVANAQQKFGSLKEYERYQRKIETEWKLKNSHCSFFGVYSFNISKWNNLNATQLKIWCNSTENVQRQYLVGYLQHSNLLMLVVENQKDFYKCTSIEKLRADYSKHLNATNSSRFNETSQNRNNYSIIRYRSKKFAEQNSCYDYYANESELFQCVNSVTNSFFTSFIYSILIKLNFNCFLFFYSFIIFVVFY